ARWPARSRSWRSSSVACSSCSRSKARSGRSPESCSAAASHCSPASSSRGCSKGELLIEVVVTNQPTCHAVHKALHRPLTICGVDRRLFFLALLMGAAMFNLFYSFLAGLLIFAGLYGFAVWATTHDPQMLAILLSSSRVKRRYDPLKHQPFDIEVRAW